MGDELATSERYQTRNIIRDSRESSEFKVNMA